MSEKTREVWVGFIARPDSTLSLVFSLLRYYHASLYELNAQNRPKGTQSQSVGQW